MKPRSWLAFLSPLFASAVLHAWDYHGHRTVNQLALKSLPADFPAFVREAGAWFHGVFDGADRGRVAGGTGDFGRTDSSVAA